MQFITKNKVSLYTTESKRENELLDIPNQLQIRQINRKDLNTDFFYFLGSALFQCQWLEQALSFYLIYKKTIKISSTQNINAEKQQKQIDKYIKQIKRKTFGQLIEELKTLTTLSENESKEYEIYLQNRNKIIHRLFTEQFFEMAEDELRLELTEQLRNISLSFAEKAFSLLQETIYLRKNILIHLNLIQK